MKLFIQIPCYNEAASLPVTLSRLPRSLPGIDEIKLLVIDDGSTDGTAEVARRCGVDYVVRFPANKGLAKAFMAGLDACLKLGADLIVNTDADNQYEGDDLAGLVAPLLAGTSDIVIGQRHGTGVEAFSPLKKLLQRFGSWVVRQASGTQVPDATSGFRAYTRDAALRLNVLSDFTYTLETIIQAGNHGLSIGQAPVRTNAAMRPSRLFRGVGQYVVRSASTIIRIYAMYQPLRVFVSLGSLLALAGVLLGARFLVFFMLGQSGGHIQSLILAAVLSIVGFQVILIGLVADLIAGHRRISEDILYRIKTLELGGARSPREAATEQELRVAPAPSPAPGQPEDAEPLGLTNKM